MNSTRISVVGSVLIGLVAAGCGDKKEKDVGGGEAKITATQPATTAAAAITDTVATPPEQEELPPPPADVYEGKGPQAQRIASAGAGAS